MNKCEVCQQIRNNLTKIYNNRIKSLAQIILKLKGFKESFEINNALSICQDCRQGLVNVASFWEHIPEAKQNFLNKGTTSLQEIYETNPTPINHQEEVVACSTKNLPAKALKTNCLRQYEEPRKPIKLKIKRIKEENDLYTLVCPNSTEEYCTSKRLRRPPKRYNDFNINLPSKSANVKLNDKNIKPSSFQKLPPMATIRSGNGIMLGNLFEVERNGQTSRMRIACDMCSNAFAYEKDFKIHIETHKANKSIEAVETLSHNYYLFHCTLCDKTFKEHYAVRRHYKCAHSEERPYQCEHCTASFKYKFNFDYHMAKHIPKKRFECSYCQKAFVMRYELNIHLRTHTKERPYKCELCPQAFAHSSNLKAHQKIKHSKIYQNTETVEATNQNEINYAESNSDSKNNLNDVEDADNISICDETKNNEEHLSSSAVNYESKELLCDDSKFTNSLTETPKSSSSQKTPNEEENRIVVRSTANMTDNFIYDYRKQFTTCASLFPIKIANTALRIMPQSSLLTMKKWPKSYQRAITENPEHRDEENKFSNFAYEISNQLNENSIISINQAEANKSYAKTQELRSEINTIDMHHYNILDCIDDKCEVAISKSQFQVDTKIIEKAINSNADITTDAKASSESVNKTQQSKESSYSDIRNLSSSACSNIKNNENIELLSNLKLKTNMQAIKSEKLYSYPEERKKLKKSAKTITNGKCSNFSPIVLDPNFSGDIKIIKVENKTKIESNPIQLLDNSNYMNVELANNESLKFNKISRTKSPNANKIKVSTKPIKIIKLNQSKTSDSLLKATNKINFTEDADLKQTSILKSVNTNYFHSNASLKTEPIFKKTESKTSENVKNFTELSLLKPEIKTALNAININRNLPSKPLITKVEILPSLSSISSLQTFLSTSASVQTHVQPPPKGYKHQCPYCWKYFKQKSPLTKHLRTHTGAKPYKCNLCQKSYADASNYKKHKILHKNAAEALTITSSTTAHFIQNSPAHSTVSDPDPDGIEIMQTIKEFDNSTLDENVDLLYNEDDDSDSLTTSTIEESVAWQDALDLAISSKDIRENIKRNLAKLKNAIMPNNVEQQLTKNDFSNSNINKSLSCEDPD